MRRIPAGLPTDGPDTRRRLFLLTTAGPKTGMHLRRAGRGSVRRCVSTKTLEEDGRVHWRSDPNATANPCPRHLDPARVRLVRKGRHGCPRHAPSSPACTGICRDMRDAGVAALRRQHLPRLEEHGPRQAGTWPEKSVSTPSTCSKAARSTRPRVYALVQERARTRLVHLGHRLQGRLARRRPHFTLGSDHFGFAILTDKDGNVRFTSDVSGRSTSARTATGRNTSRRTPPSARSGRSYEPRGRMVGLGKLPNPQVEGRWRRVGDHAARHRCVCGSPGGEPRAR